MPLSLEIVTPDGVAWHDADVDSVTLPAKDGEIDILPGHVPLITILNAGMVEVSQKGHRQDLAIDRGYARCMGDVISVLTEAAIEVEHIDTQAAEEAQAQALFRSWFVDFEPFRDGPFVDSELGKIPQGWKVGNYTDIVEIKGGGTPKTGIQEYWDGTIPFFSPKDVGASCFVLDTEKHITAKGLENCNSSLFQTNTVFITARGTVGKVVMTGTEMAMNQTNYALLGKQNISQYYVYHITRQLVTRLLKKANGAVFNAITTRDFTSEQIIIPPFSTIRQFSDVVKPIYENILLNDVQSNRLSALRDILLPKLMAGEI